MLNKQQQCKNKSLNTKQIETLLEKNTISLKQISTPFNFNFFLTF